jgi:hypothetical protein
VALEQAAAAAVALKDFAQADALAARHAPAPATADTPRSGKGLGKNEDGMADALAPKRRDDGAGVRLCGG